MERTTLEKKVIEYLEDRPYLYKNNGGSYSGEIYADYRDDMSYETAITLLKEDNPRDAFYEWLDQVYQESRWFYETDLEKELIKEFDLSEDETEDLEEILSELVFFDPPADHFLKQEFCVNITTDTGDGNTDFVLNSVYPHYNARIGEAIDKRAGIVWLAKTQGYTKGQLRHALEKGDIKDPEGFLESMRQEVINLPSHMSTVTFLVKMTLDQLLTLNELIKLQDRDGHYYDARKNPYCGWILLDKSVETGLFDPWSGGGSVFEIQLEKDVKLPIKYIRAAMPDGAERYDVQDVYGMCQSAWRDVLKEIHAPKNIQTKDTQAA